MPSLVALSRLRHASLAFSCTIVFSFGVLILVYWPMHKGIRELPLPRASAQHTFKVDMHDHVAMQITASAHYELDNAEGAEEWARLVPARGHVVYVSDRPGSPPKPFTVTLFHQMKCLDILREAYIGPPIIKPSILTRHCMNYLRQTILCRPNLWLESVKTTAGSASRDYAMVCHDWTRVYDEAERNQEEFEAWKENIVS